MSDYHNLAAASSYLLARWILPVSHSPVENGCLVIDGDKILAIISREEFERLPAELKNERGLDFGEAIITPGLINLHTHLDYSALKHFDNYSTFFTWIRGLIGNSWQWTAEQWLHSAFYGAREIIESATSTIADSSYSGAAAKAVAFSGLRGVVGLELFGIDESQTDVIFDAWLKKYQSFVDESPQAVRDAIADGRLILTVAPHTPYSVCPSLIRKALDWSRERQYPMLIHIAESEAECKWLAVDEPRLDDFLKQAFRGDLPSTPWRGFGLSPVQHMAHNNLLEKHVLAAHVVQVNDTDIEILKRHQVSIAHCPRSNSRLRNGIAPLPKMMKAGIELGFGTDSAASTDDLNVLSEARFAWDLHRAADKTFDAPAELALHYLTLGAARSLMLDAKIGSLEPGKFADISVFSIADMPEVARTHPFECLIYGGCRPVELVVNGVWLQRGGYIEENPDFSNSGRLINA